MSWKYQPHRHSLAAKGIKTRTAFAFSDWSDEKVERYGDDFGKYMARKPKSTDPKKRLEELEERRKFLDEAKDEFQDIDDDVKRTDIDAMRAEKGLMVAAAGETMAASTVGGRMIEEHAARMEMENVKNPGVKYEFYKKLNPDGTLSEEMFKRNPSGQGFIEMDNKFVGPNQPVQSNDFVGPMHSNTWSLDANASRGIGGTARKVIWK